MIPILPAIPDEQFQRGDVPMTKQEIRVFVMAHAMVAPTDIVWDIGAGTGSLSMESALRATQGYVYAMDGAAEACELVRLNAERFQVSNITIIQQKAPVALEGIPDPDVVFVGGSGGNLTPILKESSRRLKPGGRLIITAVLVETLYETLQFAAGLEGFQVESCGLQVTRIQPVAKRHMFRSLNSVYVVVCRKGECKSV
ncbi:MAG: precorrin-6Y C5,15-methyltransferase (decarboxylating) subunit CbiT [Negativicutes bacterium]